MLPNEKYKRPVSMSKTYFRANAFCVEGISLNTSITTTKWTNCPYLRSWPNIYL
jgi:hypothetical protein